MPVWEEQSYSRKDENGNLVSLEEYEATQERTGITKWMTKSDLKLYLICGTGFFIDAYDLFIVNLVNPNWQYEYWGTKSTSYPSLLKGAVNAAANIGNVVGQLLFGFLGDAMGRKFVYGKEMIIAIVGIIMVISVPNYLHNVSIAWWLFGFRLLMGIGIGGDYPMSAAIVAERSTLQNRGRMLAWIFSNQGWGNLAGSIVTLILLAIFSGSLEQGGRHLGKLDGVWRLQIGLVLVPAFAVLYFRLTMPESRKFMQSQELSAVQASSLMNSEVSVENLEKAPNGMAVNEKDVASMPEEQRRASLIEAYAVQPAQSTKWKAFVTYFSEWKHAKILLGTASTWFLVDIAFYGLNLNQSVLLAAIGFNTGSNTYHKLLRNAYGNLIIAVAGYVPGYFITIATIEILGRKWIQIQGFIVTALMFAVIAGAGANNQIGTAGQFACFAIAQLFFNFGPNATTFIVPGEIFPSRVRGFAHGFSAASGKCGAILASLLFNYLNDPSRLGLYNILWIFFALNLLGAVMTLLFVPESKGIDADAIDYEETQAKVAGFSGPLKSKRAYGSFMSKLWFEGI